MFSRTRTADPYESERMVEIMKRQCAIHDPTNDPRISSPSGWLRYFDDSKPSTTGSYVRRQVDMHNKPVKFVAMCVYSDNHEATLEPFLECTPVSGPVDRWTCEVSKDYWKKLED